MAGRKSKYEQCVKPYLDTIRKKVKEGVTEEAIANSLGICMASLSNYKLRYPELAEALSKDKGKEVLEKLINSGIVSATGQWIEEEQTIVDLDEDGNPSKVRTVTNKRYLPPNPTLNIFYAKHFGKDQDFTGDPQELALKRAKLAFEKAKQSNADWTKYD